jgi:hypothetical protein
MATKRKYTNSVSGNSAAAIAGRVKLLVHEHSLSVLAHRTGTPVTSVHRYANGGRVPAEFCGALTARMSVNPAWLLNGEGATYLTDMGGAGGQLASGLREVMDAMNAASRLSLGSISYRKDLGLLRDLSTAAAAHAQLREKLGAQVSPVAREWLAALRGALDKRDRERAQDIVDALERLLEFSDDPALRHDFDRHRALHAYVQGNRTEAATLQRRNLLVRLAESGGVSEDTLRESYNLCAALSGLGRIDEGRRFAEATLVLRGDGVETPIVRMLRCVLGLFELSLCHVDRALALITEAYVNRTPGDEQTSGFLMPTVLLRTGTASIASVLRDYPMTVQLAVEVLRHALLRERADELAHVLDALDKAGLAALGTTQIFAAQAGWILAVLRGHRKRPARDELESLEAALLHTPLLGDIEVSVLRCQRARLERGRDAARLAVAADERITAMPAEVTLDQLVLGAHARNVMALAPRNPILRAAADRARAGVKRMLSQGLGMFRDVQASTTISNPP